MGTARRPALVKLFVGLLSGDADLLRRARQKLGRRFGPVDVESEIWPFTQTDYYDHEMGPGLLRQFIAFERLIRGDQLAELKQFSNAIEQEIAEDCLALEIPRPVNLDPGYVELAKLVLASTKNATHRVYLGEGIFGEVTLHFVAGRWQPWPWTYPDFRTDHYQEFFLKLRGVYQTQLAALSGQDESAGSEIA
ncbi:MAG: DUF4416 family protein [Phycisphaerales bacterium]|nr:DUF4416 family protein [Phycisphaerales bacterium]